MASTLEQPPQRSGLLGHMSEIVQSADSQDAESRYKTEETDNGIETSDVAAPSTIPRANEKTILSWPKDDPENPHNWPMGRKVFIVASAMLITTNSTMGSSLPSQAIPYIAAEWGITSSTQEVLPVSIFLIGYLFVALWGPLSEHIGRRTVSLWTFAMFLIWTLACAFAPNWPAFLVFRLFCGISASAPIAVVTGQIADLYDDPVKRGHTLGYFMAIVLGGPLIAPIVAGFCSETIGWRWSFRVATILDGVTLILAWFLPETFGPVLLARRARKIRKADPTLQVYAAAELEEMDVTQVVTQVLTRPIRMILTELIVTATCAYLALLYAIFYISFAAFPIIFEGLYGLTPGVTGLLFLPIGAGSVLALLIFFAWDHFLRKAQRENRPWTKRDEYRRIPLACLGGPIFVISMFWLGFSAKLDIPFVVPSLAGVPYGIGYMLIFIGMLNYLTDAYEIYAASANAASLPLATTPMFDRLGISGACALLGGLSFLLSFIPFLFLWQGPRIRAGSKFCIMLKERKLEMQKKAAEAELQLREDSDNGGVFSEKEESA
ncbi:major facilitator superfamily transporter [Xylariaceae sp. FL0255]|nr:major facilitator superfamily transporter [Xylariaceae sp. FL0255]